MHATKDNSSNGSFDSTIKTHQFDLKIPVIDGKKHLPLAGTTYQLLQNNRVIRTTTSGPDGILSFLDVPVGSYFLEELCKMPGYIIHHTHSLVEIEQTGAIWIENIPIGHVFLTEYQAPTFSVQVKDTQENPVKNTIFHLTKDTVLQETLCTDTDGRFITGPLQIGTYILREATPSPGYLPNTSSYHILVNEKGELWKGGILQVGDFFINSQRQMIHIVGVKKWIDQENIENTRPQITTICLYQNETLIDTQDIKTNTLVPFTFTDLPEYDKNGNLYNYTITEKNLPNGYQTYVVGYTIASTLLSKEKGKKKASSK